MSKKTSIYLSDDLRAKLRCPPRGQSAAVGATIDRYYAMIGPDLKRVQELFTEEQHNAMRNACNGTAWIGATIRNGVLADIQDSRDSEISEYGADRKTLEKNLAALTIPQQYALVELIEKWWEDQTIKESL